MEKADCQTAVVLRPSVIAAMLELDAVRREDVEAVVSDAAAVSDTAAANSYARVMAT